MPSFCIVPMCLVKRVKGTTNHRLPTKRRPRAQWLQAFGLGPYYVRHLKDPRVCKGHFSKLEAILKVLIFFSFFFLVEN